jgi:N-acetylneuraminic acid mutarotase
MKPQKNSMAMPRVRGAVLAAILALIAGIAVKVGAQGPNAPPARWSQAATFPEPEEELYGVAANGKMYVYGGYGSGHPVGMLWEYDPATDKWTHKQTVPVPVHHSALAEFHGKIYMFGGFIYK